MSNTPQNYQTMMEAVDSLANRGYTYEFQYDCGALYCPRTSFRFKSDDLLITEVYRFEGMSDPTDNSVVYAIESRSGIKGVLVDAYGTYSDGFKGDFLKDIPVKKATSD